MNKEKVKYKNALVVSGGGTKGIFGVGVLDKIDNPKFDLVGGTSVGGLTAILVSCGKYDLLYKTWLNLTAKKIYKSNPFLKNGNFNYFNILLRLIFKKKKSLGDSSNLLKLIRNVYTVEDFVNGSEVIITITNMGTKKTEYIKKSEHSYLDFTRYVWIGTLAYPFTETYNLFGNTYADGGFTCPIPLLEVGRKAEKITAIIHQPIISKDNFKPKNIIEGIGGITDVILRDSLFNEIEAFEEYKLNHRQVDTEYYFTPIKLTDKPMYFNKKDFLVWYELGRQKPINIKSINFKNNNNIEIKNNCLYLPKKTII